MWPRQVIPRPEYPRPDRQRGLVEGIDWFNLNGPWQFRFDRGDQGHVEQWHLPRGPDWREQISVPFCWESLAAWGAADAAGNDHYFSLRPFLEPVDVTPENHRTAPRYEVGWYRRNLEIPATRAWAGKRVILTIGAADFRTDVWCNGVHLGQHEGGYDPFEFDLTDALSTRGEDEARYGLITIRTWDPMDNREQPVGKQWGWYTSTSGIWQTVFVEPRSSAFVNTFRFSPDADTGILSVDIECVGAKPDAIAQLEITAPGGSDSIYIELPIEKGLACGRRALDPLRLWSPEDPALYRVIIRLIEATVTRDSVRSYFGVRKISTLKAAAGDLSPATLCLNNKPIYLRGALYQSYHPEGVYTAADASTLRNDISAARTAGFDFLRIHLKLDDPLLLYYADELGMLLMQDLPNFGEGGNTPTGRQRFEQMMIAGFARDFNHPSIIAWCLFNETWGFGGQTELMKFIAPAALVEADGGAKISNLEAFRWVHEMWQLAKRLDPTRLIEDMSVVKWEHLAAYGHVDSDINSWHFYLNDYDEAKAHIENVVAQTYQGSNFNYVEGFQQSGVPLINSEYGGVGALDGDRDISWSFKFLTNELRRYPQLSAYIFTQLTDVEWERNGVLNYDRTVKDFGYDPALINQGDVLPINAPPISRVMPGTAAEVEVLSSHFDAAEREGVTLHWDYSAIDTLGLQITNLELGHVEIEFPHYRVQLARRILVRFPKEPMLGTLWVEARAPTGETLARNFVQHLICPADVSLREDRGNILILRKNVDQWADANWSGASTSRDEAKLKHVCSGSGSGHYEWHFEDHAFEQIARARRVRFICEMSSCRDNIAQSDSEVHPSRLEVTFNGVVVLRLVLPNHPHDSRGCLSYLQKQPGGYGYLVRATIEGPLLSRLIHADGLRVRCTVPGGNYQAQGLTVYNFDSGRFPICPTVVVEW